MRPTRIGPAAPDLQATVDAHLRFENRYVLYVIVSDWLTVGQRVAIERRAERRQPTPPALMRDYLRSDLLRVAGFTLLLVGCGDPTPNPTDASVRDAGATQPGSH